MREDRFKELSELEDGWYDGEGKRISAWALDQGQRIYNTILQQTDAFGIFPMPNGGISLEAHRNGKALEIEISNGEYNIFYADNLQGKLDDPRTMVDVEVTVQSLDEVLSHFIHSLETV